MFICLMIFVTFHALNVYIYVFLVFLYRIVMAVLIKLQIRGRLLATVESLKNEFENGKYHIQRMHSPV